MGLQALLARTERLWELSSCPESNHSVVLSRTETLSLCYTVVKFLTAVCWMWGAKVILPRARNVHTQCAPFSQLGCWQSFWFVGIFLTKLLYCVHALRTMSCHLWCCECERLLLWYFLVRCNNYLKIAHMINENKRFCCGKVWLSVVLYVIATQCISGTCE